MSMQILMPSVSSAPWWKKPFIIAFIWTLWMVPAFPDAVADDIGESHQFPIQVLVAVWTAFIVLTLMVWHYTAPIPLEYYLWGDVAMHYALGALYYAHVRWG